MTDEELRQKVVLAAQRTPKQEVPWEVWQHQAGEIDAADVWRVAMESWHLFEWVLLRDGDYIEGSQMWERIAELIQEHDQGATKRTLSERIEAERFRLMWRLR